MRSLIYNLGYFIKESGKVLRRNLISNFISILGMGLILFLLGMVLTGGSIGDRLVEMLSKEAQINAYFSSELTEDERRHLQDSILSLEGVRELRLVDQFEAREKMKEVLGEEASILELFDYNPFEAFLEIGIEIEAADTISDRIAALEGIEYVRNNREVLTRIKGIADGLTMLGYLIMAAVGVTTVILMSHLIRQGIYNNKEQINTLRLLGAPNAFIGLPYVCVGLFMTLAGGLISVGLLQILIGEAYGQIKTSIPFLPLPAREELSRHMMLLLPGISLLLGFIGSLVGLSSIRDKKG
jgi:cell division transport system permease protein